jgi:hypothetical protein
VVVWSKPARAEDDGRKLDHTTWSSCASERLARSGRGTTRGRRPGAWYDAGGGVRLAGEVPRRRVGRAASKPVPGRPPRLSGAQLARLYGLVMGTDPGQLRFAFALWTRAMVREL